MAGRQRREKEGERGKEQGEEGTGTLAHCLICLISSHLYLFSHSSHSLLSSTSRTGVTRLPRLAACCPPAGRCVTFPLRGAL